MKIKNVILTFFWFFPPFYLTTYNTRDLYFRTIVTLIFADALECAESFLFLSNENISKLFEREDDGNESLLSTQISPLKKGRKRSRDESNWKRNILKRLRNTGKAYKRKSDKLIAQREIKESCGEKCRLQCVTKITKEEREQLFNEYWALGSVTKQWTYICNSTSIIIPKYRYIRESGTRKRRSHNHAYYFNLPHRKLVVCKVFFMNTLGISDRTIRTALAKQNKVSDTLVEGDRRGKHGKHKKIDESIINGIKEYIDSLQLHGTGTNMSKVLDDRRRSITDIHKEYVNACKQRGVPFGKYYLFTMIFKEFNT